VADHAPGIASNYDSASASLMRLGNLISSGAPDKPGGEGEKEGFYYFLKKKDIKGNTAGA